MGFSVAASFTHRASKHGLLIKSGSQGFSMYQESYAIAGYELSSDLQTVRYIDSLSLWSELTSFCPELLILERRRVATALHMP